MRLGAAACLVALLSVATFARADSVEVAERLFHEGKAALEAGDHVTACAKLTESEKLDPAPGTLAMLALCHERAGRVATALRTWREALQTLQANDKRRAVAEARVRELEERAPRLTVRPAPGAPEGTRLFVDGVELSGTLVGVAVPTDPGERVVEASAAGLTTSRVTVKLAEREARAIEIAPSSAPPSAASPMVPAPDKRPPSPTSPRRTIGYVAVGAGVLALGAAAVTGILALGKKGELDDACPDKRCPKPADDLRDELRTLLTANAVLWIGGLAATGVGVALVVTSDAGASQPPRRSSTVVVRGTF